MQLLLSPSDKARVAGILELARQSYNHLACLTFPKRVLYRTLTNHAVEKHKDPTSPACRLAGHIAANLFERLRPTGEPLSFLRLGEDVTYTLPGTHTTLKGRELHVGDALVFDIGQSLEQDIDSVVFIGAGDEGVSIRLTLKRKLDRRGSLIRKYQRESTFGSLLAKRRKKNGL